jgi:hypothetical protein
MDVELRYWPHGKPIPEGWERHDGLDDTHHGAYASFIVKRDITLCQCGQPQQEPIPEGSHTVTPCCRQVVSGCCGDI